MINRFIVIVFISCLVACQPKLNKLDTNLTKLSTVDSIKIKDTASEQDLERLDEFATYYIIVADTNRYDG